jgi:DNA-binding LacI/PurR family transcriptional regulator
MPLHEMGRQAVDHLLTLLGGEPVEDVMVGTPPELVVRSSTAAVETRPG